MRKLAIALVATLTLAAPAGAGNSELLRARDVHLAAAQRSYANDPDGAQARYEAGRRLVEAVLAAGKVRPGLAKLRAELLVTGRKQVAAAEALDRPKGSRSSARLSPLPGGTAGVAPRFHDEGLSRRLAALASRFDGAAAVWVHELGSGRYGGVGADTRFAAASTVKLGAVVAALGAADVPAQSPWWYDARQIGYWSSNLAANRIAGGLGYAAVTDGLRRLGMTSSTYPGPYRATTAYAPPGPHTRVTTARDLGRALHRLHAASHGDTRAQTLLGLTERQAAAGLRVLSSAQAASQNVGLLRPWLPGAVLAQKIGWLSDQQTTAALVYRGGRITIVVIELYRPGIREQVARRFGRDVLVAAGLL